MSKATTGARELLGVFPPPEHLLSFLNYLVAGHMLDLTGESFAALRLPAILAAIVLLIGPATAFLLRKRGAQRSATWTTATTMAVFLFAAHIALGRFDPFLGSRAMARQIEPELRPA